MTGNPTKNKYDLAIIVPVYNEGINTIVIYEKMTHYIVTKNINACICYINDHSDDVETEAYLEYLSTQPNVFVCNNERRGQHSATIQGLKSVEAKYKGVIDCDMQDPVDVLFKMYESLVNSEEKAIMGLRITRDERVAKKITAAIYYHIMAKVLKEQIYDASDFYIIKSENIEHIDERNIRCSIQSRLNPIFYPYKRVKRHEGKTKYNFFKMSKLFLTNYRWAKEERRKNRKKEHNQSREGIL